MEGIPARGNLGAMSGGNGEGASSKKRASGGAAIARLAGETSDNMKKPNDGARACALPRMQRDMFPA